MSSSRSVLARFLVVAMIAVLQPISAHAMGCGYVLVDTAIVCTIMDGSILGCTETKYYEFRCWLGSTSGPDPRGSGDTGGGTPTPPTPPLTGPTDPTVPGCSLSACEAKCYADYSSSMFTKPNPADVYSGSIGLQICLADCLEGCLLP